MSHVQDHLVLMELSHMTGHEKLFLQEGLALLTNHLSELIAAFPKESMDEARSKLEQQLLTDLGEEVSQPVIDEWRRGRNKSPEDQRVDNMLARVLDSIEVLATIAVEIRRPDKPKPKSNLQ